MSQKRDDACRFLTLPGELRNEIYRLLFTHDEPIDIRRSPIPIWCEQERLWFTGEDTEDALRSHQSHPECRRRIAQTPGPDLDLGHYPCPKSIHGCDMHLSLLLTCRQIYWEARSLPYTENTFLTKDLSAFSNFTYCLKRWQVETIAHVAFVIPETRGMTMFLAEWNETFSLLAASFVALQTVSVKVQLYDPTSACCSSFWDGGLLELDRLKLQGLEFIILDQDMKPYFTYSAGSHPKCGLWPYTRNGIVATESEKCTESIGDVFAMKQPQPSPFHACRNRLRLDHDYDQDNDADLRLFFRYSAHPCPLYVRNLINLLPRRDRTHADIRREDVLQRDFSYQYAYQSSDTEKAQRVFGYQFNEKSTSEAEIAENVGKLRMSRKHLADRLASQEQTAKPRPSRRDPVGANPPSDRESTDTLRIDPEPSGQWRRLLNEETYAPLFEQFPPSDLADHVFGPEKKLCPVCSNPISHTACFLHV